MRLISQLVHRAKRVPAAEAIALCIWVGALAALEIAGRRSVSDITDAVALLVFGGLLLSIVSTSRVMKLTFAESFVAAFQNVKERLKVWGVELGVDFRQTPPVPRAVPRTWQGLLLTAVLLTSALLGVSAHCPSGVRHVLATHFYLAYLSILGVLWLSMTLVILVLGFLVWALVHDRCLKWINGRASRRLRAEWTVLFTVFACLVAAAFVLPPWVPLAVYGLQLTLLTTTLALSSSGLVFVWKFRGGGPVRSMDGRWFLWLQWSLPIVAIADMVLLSRGEAISAHASRPSDGSMPITLMLGEVLAWTALAGINLPLFESVRFAALGILFNPRSPPRPVAYFAEKLPKDTRQRVENVLRTQGWRVRCAPQRPRRTDVQIGQGDDVENPEYMDRLRRRDEIQNRRLLLRGLEKLFKRAAAESPQQGTGVWIGLQHWFVLGLGRDGDGSEKKDQDASGDETGDREQRALDEIIGPPFHQVFPRETRMHYHRITAALHIDLIFVEDGVSFRRLVRVLRVLFETYDVYGGRQRAEERHFTGLPGIRVIIHDIDLGSDMAHGRQNYPEPDYDEVGRARILHVFKDRGEQESHEPVPTGSEGIPVLSGV